MNEREKEGRSGGGWGKGGPGGEDRVNDEGTNAQTAEART